MRPILLTPGDPDGIGPEITWKALRKLPASRPILCVGARKPFERLKAPVVEWPDAPPRGSKKRPYVWLLPAPDKAPPLENGRPRLLGGYQAGWSIEKAAQLALSGAGQALVTGPISKERLQQGGYAYAGHTDFLADLCAAGAPRIVPEVTMMLANDRLRIALVTTHLALSRVPRALTEAGIRRAVLQTVDALQSWWGIQRPRVAVAALNPHAGESGLFGDEEMRVILPAIRALHHELGKSARIDGPLPADTLFAKHILAPPKERYDAVVCMYHDQGLIPVKLLDFPKTVNVTLGLPIVRTSVDHGTGFDIVGKGIADPSSLLAAIQLASAIVKKRTRPTGSSK